MDSKETWNKLETDMKDKTFLILQIVKGVCYLLSACAAVIGFLFGLKKITQNGFFYEGIIQCSITGLATFALFYFSISTLVRAIHNR